MSNRRFASIVTPPVDVIFAGHEEIRRGDLEAAIRRFEQDVRKDRNGRSLLYDALAKLQLFLKINSGDSQLHVSSLKKPSLCCL